jgi:hypothetical protein
MYIIQNPRCDRELITLRQTRLLKNTAHVRYLVCFTRNYVAEKGAFPGICSEKSQLSEMCNQYPQHCFTLTNLTKRRHFVQHCSKLIISVT